MQIVNAFDHREKAMALLEGEKLPVSDLTHNLDNLVVALQNGAVAGTAGLEIYGNYGLLRSLAVGSIYRGQGVAARLLGYLEEFAVSREMKEIYLLTETAADYFRNKGYHQITRAEVPAEVQQSSEFSFVCPQSAVVMKKILTNNK